MPLRIDAWTVPDGGDGGPGPMKRDGPDPTAHSVIYQCRLLPGHHFHQCVLSKSSSSSPWRARKFGSSPQLPQVSLPLQIAEYGRVRGRLCLLLIRPALARRNRQTSDQNQMVFSHVALPLFHRGTVALYGEAMTKGFRVWMSYSPDWFKKWRRKWRNSYLENLTNLT